MLCEASARIIWSIHELCQARRDIVRPYFSLVIFISFRDFWMKSKSRHVFEICNSAFICPAQVSKRKDHVHAQIISSGVADFIDIVTYIISVDDSKHPSSACRILLVGKLIRPRHTLNE